METQLHQALKKHFAISDDQTEVKLGKFRIDAIDQEQRLVEIQFAGLGAIRSKIIELTNDGHRVRLIRPLVANKRIVRLNARSRKVLSTRTSPKHQSPRDIFYDFIHFTQAFPHPNLLVEIVMVDVLETRVDRKRRGWRKKQFRVLDTELRSVGESIALASSLDLWDLLRLQPPQFRFDTKWLAEKLGSERWQAQQIAYVLQRCDAVRFVGKRGNSKLYEFSASRAKAA